MMEMNKTAEEIEEGHVMLAKCFKLDLNEEKMVFYMGELQVPDEDPLE